MATQELTELSKNLATQNGTVTPTTTPSPSSTPTTTPESTTTGPSPELKALSISNAKNDRGGIEKADNPLQTSVINRSIKTPTPLEKPKTVVEIQKDLLRASQSEIDQINKYAAQQIEALKPRQEERLRETSSVNTLTGLAGSTEANRTTEGTTAVNKRENDLVRAEAATKISNILSGVKTKALEMAQTEREQFRLDSETASKERTARIEEAVNNAALLAQSGVTYEGLQTTDPEAYQALADAVGGPELLKAQFTLNRPQEDILDKKIEGGKYVIAYRNPLTGATRIESVDLGLPPDYSDGKVIDAGGRILVAPVGWSGDPGELVSISKTLTPGQFLDSVDSGSGGSSTVSGVVTRDADSIMAGTLNLTDVSTAKNYRSEVAGELKKRIDEAQKVGDIYGTMKASAAYDKEVSDTFLQSMEKTISVMGQLGVLQENIAGTDTGPIVGAFRSANPWDDNAQTIKAQLNAIVPNLARGVYGEVGVLTDNDIKTYAKTIPTLTSTEDVRNAVLYITIDMIRRNVDTKIKNQAAGQRDMSGYADIYKQVQDTANSVLSTLPKRESTGGVLRSPDGTQEVNISDLSPEELEEAKNAGWI